MARRNTTRTRHPSDALMPSVLPATNKRQLPHPVMREMRGKPLNHADESTRRSPRSGHLGGTFGPSGRIGGTDRYLEARADRFRTPRVGPEECRGQGQSVGEAGVNGRNGRRLLRPTTLLLMDYCRQPRALPRLWPTPWSCTPRRATARRCLGSTVAPGQSEIGKSTIRAVSRPAASSFKKATSMPEREYAICRDYCS